jgi:hypothetical protein
VVFHVVRRTIAADGQRLLVPEVEIDTWWTSLGPRTASAEEVIELYHQHATSEQFHSELKTEMDLERLPSGKFATNALMLALGQVAYNVLRLCDVSFRQACVTKSPWPKTNPCRRSGRCR